MLVVTIFEEGELANLILWSATGDVSVNVEDALAGLGAGIEGQSKRAG
jgi:hypothetical protein